MSYKATSWLKTKKKTCLHSPQTPPKKMWFTFWSPLRGADHLPPASRATWGSRALVADFCGSRSRLGFIFIQMVVSKRPFFASKNWWLHLRKGGFWVEKNKKKIGPTSPMAPWYNFIGSGTWKNVSNFLTLQMTAILIDLCKLSYSHNISMIGIDRFRLHWK